MNLKILIIITFCRTHKRANETVARTLLTADNGLVDRVVDKFVLIFFFFQLFEHAINGVSFVTTRKTSERRA